MKGANILTLLSTVAYALPSIKSQAKRAPEGTEMFISIILDMDQQITKINAFSDFGLLAEDLSDAANDAFNAVGSLSIDLNMLNMLPVNDDVITSQINNALISIPELSVILANIRDGVAVFPDGLVESFNPIYCENFLVDIDVLWQGIASEKSIEAFVPTLTIRSTLCESA